MAFLLAQMAAWAAATAAELVSPLAVVLAQVAALAVAMTSVPMYLSVELSAKEFLLPPVAVLIWESLLPLVLGKPPP